jgi:UDP-N-acetylmuramate: L-alanyl-gamma-D-glutamyl-meso-diaminopimelate ligase
MEIFLEARGVTFIDDFAHHPTAIRETIQAARDRWPNRRLRVLFEPRSNTTVTNIFQDAMCEAFSNSHEVWLGPIHRVERIPAPMRLDREAVAQHLGHAGIPTHCADSPDAIASEVLATAAEGDIVLILSNGAFGGIYDRFRNAV